MQIYKRKIPYLAALSLIWLTIASVDCGLAQTRNAQDANEFSSPVEAYRQGMAALHGRKLDLAIPALDYAARKGVFGAVLGLARIHARGDGVPRNEILAFQYYANIAENYSDVSHKNALADYVAEAFVALGNYYRRGIPNTRIRRDDQRAVRNYRHAASHLRNPVAQYQLARMYLVGDGVKKSPRRAAQWLNLAVKQNYAPSQALLGNLYWTGKGVQQSESMALALLDVAVKNSLRQDRLNLPKDRNWIQATHRKFLSQADPKVRRLASQIVARYFNHLSGDDESTVNIANSEDLNGVIIGKVPNTLVSRDGDGTNVADSPTSDIMLGTTGLGFQQEDDIKGSGGGLLSIEPRIIQPR